MAYKGDVKNSKSSFFPCDSKNYMDFLKNTKLKLFKSQMHLNRFPVLKSAISNQRVLNLILKTFLQILSNRKVELLDCKVTLILNRQYLITSTVAIIFKIRGSTSVSFPRSTYIIGIHHCLYCPRGNSTT